MEFLKQTLFLMFLSLPLYTFPSFIPSTLCSILSSVMLHVAFVPYNTSCSSLRILLPTCKN